MNRNTEKTAKDYEVGYQKPPKEHQYRKGSSGNPNGRPKGRSDYLIEIRRALNQKVVVMQQGKRRRISKIELALEQLVNKAAKGDARSIQEVIKLALLLRDQDDGSFTLIIEGA